MHVHRLSTILLFTAALSLFPHTADGSILLSRDLSLGSVGEDVRELQIALNRDTRTQLASSGPGSPGQETTYFGPRTKLAVIKFQEIHRNEVLSPLGLSNGTGFVGALTRSTLLSGVQGGTRDFIEQEADTNASIESGQTEKDIDILVSTIRDVGSAQGYSESELEDAEEAVREIVDENPHLVEEFYRDASRNLTVSRNNENSQDLLARLFAPFFESLFPRVYAQSPLLNFGGRVLATIPCTCLAGTVWLVLVGPPSPVLANYVIGTQLHLYNNFPEPIGIWALGKWAPTPTPCPVGAPPFCVPIPTAGVITPIVGTSLIPSI